MRQKRDWEVWDSYSYGLCEKLIRYGLLFPFVAIAVCAALAIVVGAAGCLVLLLRGEVVDCRPLWIPVCTFLFTGYLCTIFLNEYPDIRTSDEGLAVQVFLFWWVFIPWEDVVDVRLTTIGKMLGSSRSCLVVVRRLTPVHTLIGGTSGTKYQPAFLIRETLEGYADLMKLLRARLETTGQLVER